MNRKRLPHLVTAVALAVFIALGLGSGASVPRQWEGVVYQGEDTPVLAGTAWALTTEGWEEHRAPILLDLLPNGQVGRMKNSSWERVGQNVKVVTQGGFNLIEGTLNADNNTITGTISESDGRTAAVKMALFGTAGTTLFSNETNFSAMAPAVDAKLQVKNANGYPFRFVLFTEITGYSGTETNVRLPPTIGGKVVLTVKRGALANKQLTRVTFPVRVNVGRAMNIRYETNLVSEGVEDADVYWSINTVEAQAFANNQLTALEIPYVSRIGDRAFAGNPLTSITIGSNVTFEGTPFDGAFEKVYTDGGKLAGTYTRPSANSAAWVRQ